MQIEITQAVREDEPLLSALVELYEYEFTEFTDDDVDDDGRYGSGWIARYWTEPDRYAFLARADGKLAGFAFVRRKSELGVRADPWDMDEFFVLIKYRRHGVGRKLARTLFERFRGHWEVREMTRNLRAQSFWRSVIGEHTGGKFEERMFDTEAWRGPVQFFES